MTQIDWDHVYWEQVPRLYNFFRYRTGDSEIAKDLTSQTMLKAWRYRQQYDRDLGAFSAWLFQIARHLVVDHYRKNPLVPIPFDDLEFVPAAFSLEREAQQRADSQHLYQLLARLSIREQDIIALKFGADMTNREIARVLDLSESNVGTILHRSIQTLRNQWEVSYVRE